LCEKKKKERGGARKRLSGSQLCVNPHTHTHDSNIYPHQTKGARARQRRKKIDDAISRDNDDGDSWSTVAIVFE
jgi:hypothetical protein